MNINAMPVTINLNCFNPSMRDRKRHPVPSATKSMPSDSCPLSLPKSKAIINPDLARKAYDMYNERMDKFKKLPPIMGGAREAPGVPRMTQPTDSGSGES
jgi:hypothetical protein